MKTVVEISTVAIALFAFGIAVWEGFTQRRHNRLSVMPRLTIRTHLGGKRGKYGLTVSNDGLGTAIITDARIEVDGEPMEKKGDDGWNAALGKLNLSDGEVIFESIAPDNTLRAGDEVWLLQTPRDGDWQSRLSERLHRFRMEIDYESMYGEKKTTS